MFNWSIETGFFLGGGYASENYFNDFPHKSTVGSLNFSPWLREVLRSCLIFHIELSPVIESSFVFRKKVCVLEKMKKIKKMKPRRKMPSFRTKEDCNWKRKNKRKKWNSSCLIFFFCPTKSHFTSADSGFSLTSFFFY